ncbi:MAG TPA: dienelactone hydrolase family protein [Rhabdochlamydiaceae bacterium]|jgi:dienelactone hydrolase|nr:dienelactone hydrolase family protein [Rhabdochlamydiaceae bacterium]
MPTIVVPYTDGSTTLEGFAANTIPEKRPIVILCHAWSGRDSFICEKAEMMARWGYVGFALDMYGKGVIGKSKEENASLKKPFLDDRSLLQRRLLKGYEAARAHPYGDPSKIGVVGFGFGGLCALDLAREVDLRGAVSVYGHYEAPPKKKPIKAKILLLQGYGDPIVKQEQLREFADELTNEKVDWQAHVYGNTMHAFMNPAVNMPEAGLLYNPVSAQRAWHAIQGFLEEIFSF